MNKKNVEKMDRNNEINNNINYGVDFTGPHAVIHHQHHQMVDLLMQYCRRSMCGLYPHVLPHAPSKCQESDKIKGKQKEKEWKPNLSQPTQIDGRSKQGWKTCNKNKGKKRENITKQNVKKPNID